MIDVRLGDVVIENINLETKQPVYPVIDALNALMIEKIPFQISYRLSKIVKELNEEIKTYQEVKTKLIQDHGEEVKDADGKLISWQTKPEHLEHVLKEIDNLCNQTIQLKGDKFKSLDFGDVPIETRHMLLLENWLIAE